MGHHLVRSLSDGNPYIGPHIVHIMRHDQRNLRSGRRPSFGPGHARPGFDGRNLKEVEYNGNHDIYVYIYIYVYLCVCIYIYHYIIYVYHYIYIYIIIYVYHYIYI